LQCDWDNKERLDNQWSSNNNVINSDYDTYSLDDLIYHNINKLYVIQPMYE